MTRRPLLLAFLAGALVVPSADAQPSLPAASPSLRAYLSEMGGHMNAYRMALTRADRAFDEPSDRIAAAQLRARSAEFKRLAARIKPVRAPVGLGTQHKKILKAIQIVASSFEQFAAARKRYMQDNNTAALIRANTQAHNRLRTAEVLEVAWATAVRARTVKAGLSVPAWLQDFFTS